MFATDNDPLMGLAMCQFLLFDSGVGDHERIFGSPEATRLMQQNAHWFCDGTFEVGPELFYQVYTIHAKIGHDVFPCIYVLLPNKTEGS